MRARALFRGSLPAHLPKSALTTVWAVVKVVEPCQSFLVGLAVVLLLLLESALLHSSGT